MTNPLSTLALRLHSARHARKARRDTAQIYRALLAADEHLLLDIGATREEIAAHLARPPQGPHPGGIAYLIARLTYGKFS
jgi:uncharacterized protein YjiS (DUF1127 family)